MLYSFQGSFNDLAAELLSKNYSGADILFCTNKEIDGWRRAPRNNFSFRVTTPFGSYVEDFSLLIVDATARVSDIHILHEDALKEQISLLVWYENETDLLNAQEEVITIVERVNRSHQAFEQDVLYEYLMTSLAEGIFEGIASALSDDKKEAESGRLAEREVEHKSNGTLGLDGSLEQILGDLSDDERVQSILSRNFTCPITFCEGSELSQFTVLLCCLRAYETQALNSWLSRHPKCPTCRTKIDSFENLSIGVHRDGENVSKLGKVAQLLSSSSEHFIVVSSSRMPYIPLARQYWRLSFVTTLDNVEVPEGDYSVIILSSHEQEREKVAKFAPKAQKIHLVY